MKSEKLSLTGVAEKLRVIADAAEETDKVTKQEQRRKWRLWQRNYRQKIGQAQYAETEEN